jgi:hypothetical protein
MPIPAVTSQDVFLRILLDEQVRKGAKEKIRVEDVIKGLSLDADVDPSDGTLPSTVRDDIERLERLHLLEFYPANPHVRLTSTGIYTALLFNKIEREGQTSEPAAPV